MQKVEIDADPAELSNLAKTASSALMNAMHQRLRHVIGPRMGRDQRVELAMSGLCEVREGQCRERGKASEQR